jgi:uncharacterized protein (TIGR02118 family)
VVKFVAIYKTPADKAAFDAHYKDIHAPLAQNMPDLRKFELSRFFGSPMGEARYYLMAELYFDDEASMMASLGSPEGKAAGKDVMGFAGDIVHMMFANVE